MEAATGEKLVAAENAAEITALESAKECVRLRAFVLQLNTTHQRKKKTNPIKYLRLGLYKGILSLSNSIETG